MVVTSVAATLSLDALGQHLAAPIRSETDIKGPGTRATRTTTTYGQTWLVASSDGTCENHQHVEATGLNSSRHPAQSRRDSLTPVKGFGGHCVWAWLVRPRWLRWSLPRRWIVRRRSSRSTSFVLGGATHTSGSSRERTAR